MTIKDVDCWTCLAKDIYGNCELDRQGRNNGNHSDGSEVDVNADVMAPDWCPLRQGPVTLRLKT